MKKFIVTAIIFMLLSACTSTKFSDKTVLFQDDFEKHTIHMVPHAPWEKSGAGSVLIVNDKSASGEQSVHFISGEAYANRAFLGIENVFPVVGNQYYGSMQIYVEKASPDGVHWTMLQSSGVVAGKNYRSEVRYGGQHQQQLMANYETMGVNSDCWQHSTVKIPEGVWSSIQWFFDGETDTMQFWLNDVLLDELTVTGHGQGCVANGTQGEWNFPVFEDLVIGWVDYQTGGGERNVWIDDVILWQLN